MDRRATTGEVAGRWARERDSLMRAAKAVLRFDAFDTTARTIFDEACRMTGARSGYVALLSETGEENEVLFLEAGGMPCTVDPELPMAIRGLRAEAYERNETVWDNDFANSEWARFMPAGHVVLRNVMFAPLVIHGKTAGIMGLANKDGDFTEEDAEIAASFGEFAAIALANSRNLDELRSTIGALESAFAEVKTLRGIIPICSHCKSVRDEEGYWQKVEDYVTRNSEALFSHSLCGRCVSELYDEELVREVRGQTPAE